MDTLTRDLAPLPDSETTANGLPPPGAPDIDIARAASMRPIIQLAEQRLDVPASALVPYGHYKAKLSLDHIQTLADRKPGKLVLVTAITPTPAGEGKTTTSVGLSDALNRLGYASTVCLREPSLGPCFGMKGGAAGGGRAQVLPMEDINLHFNGDFHAITAAHNLLAALIDNHLQWGNDLDLDPRRIVWRRVLDMNDRALRDIVCGLGGPGNGVPREDGFDITVASELMAILCLASDLADLERRLGAIIIGRTRKRAPVRVRDLGAEGAMLVLLKDALAPNLVQSIEHNPAFIHGGPFANIAHGCNSVIATKTAMALSDVVVTEAGFGADLGAEKFLDIKCRQSGLRPDAVVVVATVRALKMHGGVAAADLAVPNLEAVRMGGENLHRHIENLQSVGLRPVVAINQFQTDTEGEFEIIKALCAKLQVPVALCHHWAEGGQGAEALGRLVAAELEREPASVELLYDDDLPLADKIRAVAKRFYRADDVSLSPAAAKSLAEFTELGYGDLPVCIAKTQYSFSADPTLKGAPTGHTLPVREARLAAGAGFVVAICGDVMTMPGLPRQPAALSMSVDPDGTVHGLS